MFVGALDNERAEFRSHCLDAGSRVPADFRVQFPSALKW